MYFLVVKFWFGFVEFELFIMVWFFNAVRFVGRVLVIGLNIYCVVLVVGVVIFVSIMILFGLICFVLNLLNGDVCFMIGRFNE